MKTAEENKKDDSFKNSRFLKIFLTILIIAAIAGYAYYVSNMKKRIKNNEDITAETVNSDQTEEAENHISKPKSGEKYKAGDIIEYGSYPYYADGEEKAIEWQILEKNDDGTALVISRYALDSMPYYKSCEHITWEQSTIRQWLNNDFYDKAFQDVDKNIILESNVINEDNKQFDSEGGNDTKDKIFLLSINEANKYFDSDVSRAAEATPYAEKRGVWTVGYVKRNHRKIVEKAFPQWKKKGFPDFGCWWWLRSPGMDNALASLVLIEGEIYNIGYQVNGGSGAIRVAMKIDLSKFS